MFTKETEIVSEGIQSTVEFGDFNGQKAVRKVSGRGLNPRELRMVGRNLAPYRESLTRGGLRPPENLRMVVGPTEIEIIEKRVEGKTVSQLVDEGNMTGLRKMVRSVVEAKNTFVDAKTPNFIEDNGGVRCVDTFPPMLRGADRKINPWVAKLFKRDRDMMTFNFGDVRGQMTKLLSLARLELPDVYDQVKEEVLSELRGSIEREDYQYITNQVEANFPDMEAMYKNPRNAGRIARVASRRAIRFTNGRQN